VPGTWYHVVSSWDGTNVKTYVDGVEEKSYALASLDNKAATTRIGSSADSEGYELNGLVDEVTIYDKALTEGEIKSLYEMGEAGGASRKVCCTGAGEPGLFSVREWRDTDGNNITSANIGDTVQAVVTNSDSGTFNLWERTFLDEKFLDIAGESSGVNLVGRWTITDKSLIDAGGTSRFVFEVDNDEEYSGELSVDTTYDDSSINITIISPVCGTYYNENEGVLINVSAKDEDDFINGSVTINGVVENTFVNGVTSFSYNFSSPGNYQIIAEGVNSRGKRGRHISNIMILDRDNNGMYVAACIASPKDFSDIDDPIVAFDASTTRGVVVSDGGATVVEVTPEVSPDRFSWYWRFMPENVAYPTSGEEGTSLEYRFNQHFPIAGDNSAGLRVEFE